MVYLIFFFIITFKCKLMVLVSKKKRKKNLVVEMSANSCKLLSLVISM